ncbi:MAG: glycosyltransferase family 4 protein [Kiritimatiellia bacterium]
MTETAKPVVAVVGGSGSIGGTQKAAALLACGLVQRGYRVHFLCETTGPWVDYGESMGVRVQLVEPGPGPLLKFLCAVRPDILHQHVPGQAFANPVYPALWAMPPGPRPALIETNVFGWFGDSEGDRWTVRRMFVSRSSCVQAYRRSRRPLNPDSLKAVAVLSYPVLGVPPLSPAARAVIREELGIGPGELLAIRVGRPDPRKWTDWECRAFCHARRRNSRLRFLLVGPPEDLSRRVQAGAYGPGIVVRPVFEDSSRLNAVYGSADWMVHSSLFGESFGYTIAEAMALGLSVITLTTPYGDNAQVELVENGVTGWVCISVGEMSRRWLDLAGNPIQRAAMGDAGRGRIAGLADLDRGLDVLEAVFQEALTGSTHPLLAAQRRDLLEFARDFPAREWRASEGPRRWRSPLSRIYASYRHLRSGLRRLLASQGFQPDHGSHPLMMRSPAGVTVNEPVRLAILADGSIGGMQKAAARYAVGLARAGMEVDFISTGEGPWTQHCLQNGVRVRVIPSKAEALAKALGAVRPHVIHQHVSGYDANSFQYKAYDEVRRCHAFRVIESNVFGRLDDAQSERWVNFRFFKSTTSLIGANRLAGRELTSASLASQGVLYNPIERRAPLTDLERQEFRRELGLDDGHRLVVRTGRPDLRKWADWECRAFQAARHVAPELRLVLIEPPDWIKRRLARGWYGPGIKALAMTDDFDWLARFYQSADMMLHASFFGESFGYSIAEGMVAGLPVVVRSTPYGDNAQVELVENGVTGWVCMSVSEMGRRIADLARDGAARVPMGERGRARIHDLAASETGVALLRAAIDQTLEGRRAEVLDRQREGILRYAEDGDRRQWRCSEGWDRHPADYLAGRAYALYRTSRAKVRRAEDALRRLVVRSKNRPENAE